MVDSAGARLSLAEDAEGVDLDLRIRYPGQQFHQMLEEVIRASGVDETARPIKAGHQLECGLEKPGAQLPSALYLHRPPRHTAKLAAQ
jgi:hypothetical protein